MYVPQGQNFSKNLTAQNQYESMQESVETIYELSIRIIRLQCWL